MTLKAPGTDSTFLSLPIDYDFKLNFTNKYFNNILRWISGVSRVRTPNYTYNNVLSLPTELYSRKPITINLKGGLYLDSLFSLS